MRIVIAKSGVTITVIGPSPEAHHRLFGVLLAVGTLFSFSTYWLASIRTREMQYVAAVLMIAAAVTTLVVLISGQNLLRTHVTD